jgi:YD repeat-containing protein
MNNTLVLLQNQGFLEQSLSGLRKANHSIFRAHRPPRGATTYGYTPTGQVSALTDAESQVTLYDYSARGEKIRETYPDHVSGAGVGMAGYGIVQFSYDPAGFSRPAANRLQGAHFA